MATSVDYTPFANDAQVRRALGEADHVRLQYIVPHTPHRSLAENLLLDPDSTPIPDWSPLVVQTGVVSAAQAHLTAREIRMSTEELVHDRRKVAPVLCTIVFNREPEPLAIEMYVYTVPVGYRVLGQTPDGQFYARTVLEQHRCALLRGRIVANAQGKLHKRDEAIVRAVQQLQGKTAEKEGDPLPMLEALAYVILEQRNLQKRLNKTTTLPEDVRQLLRCNQAGTDVEVVMEESDDPTATAESF